MNSITLFRNFDERQPVTFKDSTLSGLRYNLERWGPKHMDECDGLTLGEPDIDAKHFILSRNENTPRDMEWELTDNVDFEDSECGTFEVMYLDFVNVIMNYIGAGMAWK